MSLSIFNRLRHRFDKSASRVDALTRREMLRASAAAAAGLLLSGTPAFAQSGAGKRVVVVGAGFAGLACAYELRSAGYDVTLIEARNRVGGRVLSFGDFVPGRNVEGGAELIGSNHPTWVAYAERFKLEFLDVTEDENLASPILLDGKLLSKEEAEKVYEEMDAAFATLNKDAEAINADRPWESPRAAELDKRTTGDWLKSVECSPLTRKAITALLVADNGVALDKQSYLGMLTQIKGGGVEKYWTDSEVYRCKGGNQQLATKLAEAIGKDRVVLKLAVTEIDIKDKNSVVKCADGRTLECDDVVLAVPPTVWSKIKVNPALPATLMPQMGMNLKYLAHLKKRVWKDAGLSPDSLSDAAVSETWDGTDNQPGDENVCMVGFSGGPAADTCMNFPKERRDEQYKAELEKVYPGWGGQFVAARFMEWPRDPWTLGGYSFPAPGQISTQGPLLYKGLGRLHFCGEHTSYKFVGYMEGGLNSGAAVAKRIAARAAP